MFILKVLKIISITSFSTHEIPQTIQDLFGKKTSSKNTLIKPFDEIF